MNVDSIIDGAAVVAKDKIGGVLGGNKKKGSDSDQKKKEEGGIGDMVTGAIGKMAAKKATESAADQALSFGKNLFK